MFFRMDLLDTVTSAHPKPPTSPEGAHHVISLSTLLTYHPYFLLVAQQMTSSDECFAYMYRIQIFSEYGVKTQVSNLQHSSVRRGR